MVSNNRNEAITMPRVDLPVLLRSTANRADGRVVGYNWTGAGLRPVDVPVRIVPGAALGELIKADGIRDTAKRDQALEQFAGKYGSIAREWRDTLGAVFRAAIRTARGKRDEAREIIEGHLQDRADFERLVQTDLADWLVRMLSDGLRKPDRGVEFVIWWNDKAGSLAAGLLCPDARTAAYALLLRGVGQAGGLGICAKCGNPFPATRAKRRYCSHSCQTAAAMVRYRAGLKSPARRARPHAG